MWVEHALALAARIRGEQPHADAAANGLATEVYRARGEFSAARAAAVSVLECGRRTQTSWIERGGYCDLMDLELAIGDLDAARAAFAHIERLSERFHQPDTERRRALLDAAAQPASPPPADSPSE